MTRASTEEIWASLAVALRSYISGRVANPVIVEDLLQEVFVRVHAKSGELRDTGSIAPWVFRIARSIVVDFLRARGRTPPEDEFPASLEADGHDDGIRNQDAIARRELAAWLARMVETLDPVYAEAVRLTDLEGIPQAEAAAALGLSHSGFKSRVQRGRAKLRTLLDKCCLVELDVRGRLIDYKPGIKPGVDSCC